MKRPLAFVAAACLVVLSVAAQEPAAQQPAASPAAAAPATATVSKVPRVISVTGFGPDGTAGLGHLLRLEVENFDQLLAESGGTCSGINLFINNLPVYIKPVSCNRQDRRVHFILDRDPEDDRSDPVWHQLLGSPQHYVKKVRVSVGPNDQFSYPSSVEFDLFLIPKRMLFLFALILVVSLVLFIFLCRRTAIIRSPVAPPAGVAPYSLSRFQMAFWFYLVIAGYVFMWMITGELDTISESILALIGIGAGTALGAAVIDAPGAPPDGQPAPPPPTSRSFITDVLTDNQGVMSLHRFQMFVWTLILGVIFVASVYRELSMPEFSATLLGLMGISSGTYLGFKFPEKNQQSAGPGEGTPSAAGTTASGA